MTKSPEQKAAEKAAKDKAVAEKAEAKAKADEEAKAKAEAEAAEKAAAEAATPPVSARVITTATVFDGRGTPIRTYNREDHGQAFESLAKEYAAKIGGTVR